MNSGSPTNRLQRLRELVTGGLLFLTTAAFVLWQNSQLAVLWDISYLLDTSWRIALGQVPYRDFPLVHPPLTFVLQAALIRLFGRVYLTPILYAAVTGGLGTVITWAIIRRILKAGTGHTWLISLVLAAPLVFVGIYGIYPHPIYDCDCALAILAAIYALQRIGPSSGKPWLPFTAGVLSVLPVFFKQNMGVPFLLLVVLAALVLFAASPKTGPSRQTMALLLAGIAAASLVGLGAIHLWAGLGNYLHWTVTFAGQRRLPGFADMLAVYRQPSFVWTIPTLAAGLLLLHAQFASRLWVRIAAVCLFSAPFVESLLYLVREDDLDERADHLLALWPLLLLAAAVYAMLGLRKGLTLNSFLPFFLLAAIHGTLLSQQLWGSTYAIWPLLTILIAGILAGFPASRSGLGKHGFETNWPGTNWPSLACATAISGSFLVCGALYAAGHERLNYAQLPAPIPDQPALRISQPSLPALRGMSIPGPFLPDIEELVAFTEREIPPEDGILLLPGEEPFFYATGRTPRFPVQIFDLTTDPYSPAELLAEARKRNIRWGIVKTRLQLNEDPLPAREQTMKLIQAEFSQYARLGGYDVYRRR